MYECLLQFGGPLAHNFVSQNLLGPAINTSKALYRRDALVYTRLLLESDFVHLAKLLREIKALKGVEGLIPFECSEDKSACIALATWNRRTDCIVGFCGRKAVDGAPHTCTFDCNPSASTFGSIQDAFQNLVVGTMCLVLVLNPLVAGLPTLVLGILPTCNTFIHESIRLRWNHVRSFLDAHFADVGVLISHASDGDRRRVKCQLQDMLGGTYGLDDPSFSMKARMENGFPALREQDPFHVGKKLRNPLLVALRNVFWGTHLATINHLRLVMSTFSQDEHGLLEEDVDVRDRQNVPAVQRIASKKVHLCLQKLQDGVARPDGSVIQEDVLGTILHLEVFGLFWRSTMVLTV
jgi:hypothetical protein